MPDFDPASLEPVVLRTEEQSIRQLNIMAEVWEKHGDALVSRHSFLPDAVTQHLSALSQATRDKLRLRLIASDLHPGGKRFAVNARAAEQLFSEYGLTMNITSHTHGRWPS